jgi:hypothetical protein
MPWRGTPRRGVLLEHVDRARIALDVGENGHSPREAEVLLKRSRECEQRGLGLIDEDELAHAQTCESRAQLGADRSCGAGDENGRAGEVLAELSAADVDDRAAEQRLDDDVLGAHTTVRCPHPHTVAGDAPRCQPGPELDEPGPGLRRLEAGAER